MVGLAVKAAGSQDAFKEATGVDQATLSLVLAGKRDPSPKLLKALGYERITTYRRIKP